MALILWCDRQVRSLNYPRQVLGGLSRMVSRCLIIITSSKLKLRLRFTCGGDGEPIGPGRYLSLPPRPALTIPRSSWVATLVQ